MLNNGFVTFGCLNKPVKAGPGVIGTWSRILRRVPRSRLMLLSGYAPGREAYFTPAFAAHGVEPERLTFAPKMPRLQYLDLLGRIDIALDPFPYNGGVTSCDTLWMGVPLVTLQGDSYRARQGHMLLSNVGLDDLACRDEDAYADAAVALASGADRLRHLRPALRQRLQQTPLCQYAHYCRELQQSYRDLLPGTHI
jgi:predicted O-linked N-acetylglucosamine transferase (SPINDLY family)